jgi:predicted ATPase
MSKTQQQNQNCGEARASAAFGDLLREHRLEANLSQEQLAEIARLSVGAIGALERGVRRAPYRRNVTSLIKALKLNQDQGAELEAAALRARRRSAPAHTEEGQRFPTRRTKFVGRDEDIRKITALLSQFRVVTVAGSGGIGKTRVALEVARRAPEASWDDVCFAELSAVSDGAFIAGKIASAIQPPLTCDIEEMATVAEEIANRRMLLVLDGCEHLVADVARAVEAIMKRCPRLTVLATSRAHLKTEGETVYRLPPLTLPDAAPRALADVTRYSALDLFVQRTRERDPSVAFTVNGIGMVFDICRRLEGIPLAIELATARLSLLGLRTLHARLDDHFSLPGTPRDLPPRQHTMQATVAWSFDLLVAPERELLCRLAIFSGGFTLEAAESVCAFEPIERATILHALVSLADKSLIDVVHTRENVRYRLLDSVRSFALERLERSNRQNDTARRHAQWLAALAGGLDPSYVSHLPYEKFVELSPEIENVRAALDWALASPAGDDRALGGQILYGLQALFLMNGRSFELQRRNEAALERIDEATHPELAAKMLLTFIAQAFNEPAALGAIARAIPLFDRIGDATAIIRLHSILTFIFASRGRLAEARDSAERAEALFAAQRMKTSQAYATFLTNRSMLREAERRFGDARADIARAEAIATSFGDRFFVIRGLWFRLLWIEFQAGDGRRAVEIAEQMLASEYGTTPEVVHVANAALAMLHLLLGDPDAAESAARAVLSSVRSDESLVIQYVAGIAAMRGHPHVAARLTGFLDALLSRRPQQRDLLQERTWNLLCASLESQLHPDVISARGAEGANLTAQAATAEAFAALDLPNVVNSTAALPLRTYH